MVVDKRRTVFISGSAYEYGRFGDSGKNFIKALSKSLLQNNFKLVSGFGSGVGTYIVEGALEEMYERKERISDHLLVYPFPHNGPIDHPEEIKMSYRDDMISRAGVAIFLFGNKLEEISVRDADGMLKEFDLARSKKALLIPVGASGYVSERLWKEVVGQYDDYFDNREKFGLYQQLGDAAADPDQLIDTIIKIAQ